MKWNNEESMWLGNPVSDWMTAIATAVAVILIFRLAIRFWQKFFSKAIAQIDEAKVQVIDRMVVKTSTVVIAVAAFEFVLRPLTLPGWLEHPLRGAYWIGVAYQCATWLTIAFEGLVESSVSSKDRQAGYATSLNVIKFIGRVGIWTGAILIALDNLGVNVTTLVTGLGVGGVAVALAVQSILGDLFASLSIVFDRPFEIGDTIAVAEMTGTVEHVGLKTTRVRSVNGEQLIFSNSELLKSRIRNLKRMEERRIVLAFGLHYETTSENLRQTPDIIKNVVDGIAGARFDRASFLRFGESSLEFELIYFVKSPEFAESLNVQHQVNLGITEALRSSEIQFAYPTRTVHLAGYSGVKL
jgi:small-conductance mechanosensitive channel